MSVLYVKGASLYICGHLNYTTILSWVQTNGAPTVVHTRVKSVFTLIHQTVNISFHPHSVMSVINGQLPQFSFFFYLSSLPRLCRYVWDLLSSATPQSAKEGRPTKFVFFFFFIIVFLWRICPWGWGPVWYTCWRVQWVYVRSLPDTVGFGFCFVFSFLPIRTLSNDGDF